MKTELFFRQFLGQEEKLPQWIRESINDKIILYSFVDLDSQYESNQQWLVIGRDNLYIVGKSIEREIKLAEIASIKESDSLSSTSLTFIKAHDLPPLLRVNSTLRQKPMLSQIKFYLEEIVSKNSHALWDKLDADSQYQKMITQKVVEAQSSGKVEDRQTLGRLLTYLKPYRKDLAWGACGAFGATLIGLVPPYVSGKVIDHVVKPFQDGKLDLAEAMKIGWILIATLAVSYAMKELFMWIRLRKMSILGEKVAYDLRIELYSHLQTLGLDFFAKKHSGSIITRVSSDTDRIWDFIAFGIVEVSVSIMMLTSLAIVLITLNPLLGLTMTIPVPLLLISIYFHGERMKRIFIRCWRKWSDVTSVLSDTIPGIQVVKAFNQEEREKKRFHQKLDRVTNEFFNVHLSWTKFWPKLMLGIHAITVLTWSLAFPKLVSSDPTLTAGVFVSFLLYMTMFSQPIEIIGQVTRMLNRAISSAYRIFEILDAQPSIFESKSPIVLSDIKGNIEFKNVFYSYDGVRTVLKNMSFSVKQGEMIGLVGESGGGKSTITKLIARFYDVTNGQITIDGVDVKEIETSSLKKSIGMVLQEPYLFHGSIAENIAYARPEASLKEIISASKDGNAHDFIMRLPFGYDTVIGERGHTLSGGERQRVSIARAILADPKILILDEATSAVDTETERKIQEALDRLAKGRTVFAVAHRLSTLQKADRLIVIKKGEIVESGTHQELLQLVDGEYAKLHHMQSELNAEFVKGE
ncbi:MAG: ABC transporter [Bdellovibrio sp. CG12_big_fil_rev_8_21_14_0_65_39_13]|nr:MAG: ABC transporter [Bdellovibrio sp. CG22_combo_CG10-13_8_21_14_all_39_27]PIQ58034.1 MAG: ABC transporter [Bdellovibrio sp. CG12_big_fil_rev_8_21_14_0_65_39_13]PIR36944.1 MAG: ABC transporter [Bdellovibrio sp. CG11_big_fil_rev_8_21_14_0_20_39_38]